MLIVQNHGVHRLMYSQYEDINVLINMGKTKCHRTTEGCLLLIRIVT